MKNQIEIWKLVVGYEGFYEISSIGTVKSLLREVLHPKSGKLTLKEKILKHVYKRGYPSVTLHKNTQSKQIFVHRLVAEAFIPNPENKPFVNHIDGIKNNPKIGNLEWCTCKENTIHAFNTGLRKMEQDGEANPSSVVTEKEVRQMRELQKTGMKKVDIANMYPHMSTGNIYHILNNKTWKHII